MKANISNHCWKTIKEGWVICIDMDEFLFISEELLMKEQEKGTTILSTQGVEMIGESNSEILDDIHLNAINKGVLSESESKCVCFYRPKIKEMNYDLGCHFCNPIGCIKFSDKIYIIKHFSFLGLPFFVNKMTNRKERSKRLINEMNISPQYNKSKEYVANEYLSMLSRSFNTSDLAFCGHFVS